MAGSVANQSQILLRISWDFSPVRAEKELKRQDILLWWLVLPAKIAAFNKMPWFSDLFGPTVPEPEIEKIQVGSRWKVAEYEKYFGPKDEKNFNLELPYIIVIKTIDLSKINDSFNVTFKAFNENPEYPARKGEIIKLEGKYYLKRMRDHIDNRRSDGTIFGEDFICKGIGCEIEYVSRYGGYRKKSTRKTHRNPSRKPSRKPNRKPSRKPRSKRCSSRQ